MFTGIISAIGSIGSSQNLGDTAAFGKRIWLHTPTGYLRAAPAVQLGDSLAVQGACMTVLALAQDSCAFDISAASLRLVGGIDIVGRRVNLEKALRLGDPMGGHMVSGHVDGQGQVHALHALGESHTCIIDCPRALSPYLVLKGSIAIDGVSLTINHLQDRPDACRITLNLIAHTLAHSTLGQLTPGSSVNLEVDTIARHVARILEPYAHAPRARRGEDGMML